MSDMVNRAGWVKSAKSHNKIIKRLIIGAKAVIKASDKAKEA